MKGLALPLYWASRNLVATRSSFSLEFYYTRVIERACIRIYVYSGKWLSHQYSAIGIQSRSEDPFDRGQFHLWPIVPMQVAFQTISDFRLVMVIIAGRVNTVPYRVFGMGLQAMAVILDYEGQYLKVF